MPDLKVTLAQHGSRSLQQVAAFASVSSVRNRPTGSTANPSVNYSKIHKPVQPIIIDLSSFKEYNLRRLAVTKSALTCQLTLAQPLEFFFKLIGVNFKFHAGGATNQDISGKKDTGYQALHVNSIPLTISANGHVMDQVKAIQAIFGPTLHEMPYLQEALRRSYAMTATTNFGTRLQNDCDGLIEDSQRKQMNQLLQILETPGGMHPSTLEYVTYQAKNSIISAENIAEICDRTLERQDINWTVEHHRTASGFYEGNKRKLLTLTRDCYEEFTAKEIRNSEFETPIVQPFIKREVESAAKKLEKSIKVNDGAKTDTVIQNE